jgi:putative phosphoesterase
MNIVVMSDTHLDGITDEFKQLCDRYCEKADMVIHLGDWTRSSLLNYMERYPLEAVAGNMDEEPVLDRLPLKKVVQAGRFRIGIIHGWGSAQGLKRKLAEQFQGVDAILFGHTHQPLICRENGLLWFNPGSVFLGRGAFRRSLGTLTVGERIEAGIVQI